MLPVLARESSALHYLENLHPRLATREEIEHYGFPLDNSEIELFLEKAREEKGIVLITGTFFIMSQMKRHFGLEKITDPILLYD